MSRRAGNRSSQWQSLRHDLGLRFGCTRCATYSLVGSLCICSSPSLPPSPFFLTPSSSCSTALKHMARTRKQANGTAVPVAGSSSALPKEEGNGTSSVTRTQSTDSFQQPPGPLSIIISDEDRDEIKVNNANVSELKNACDDALKRVRVVINFFLAAFMCTEPLFLALKVLVTARFIQANIPTHGCATCIRLGRCDSGSVDGALWI